MQGPIMFILLSLLQRNSKISSEYLDSIQMFLVIFRCCETIVSCSVKAAIIFSSIGPQIGENILKLPWWFLSKSSIGLSLETLFLRLAARMARATVVKTFV